MAVSVVKGKSLVEKGIIKQGGVPEDGEGGG